MVRGRHKRPNGKYNPRGGGYITLPEVALLTDTPPEQPIDHETEETRAAQLQLIDERIKQLLTPPRGRRG